MKLPLVLPVVLVALAASGAHAQDRRTPAPVPEQQKAAARDIPASMRPPARMCRIWLDDVPAAQQPAPTDCASAVRNRPAKGRVIFGDDYVKKGRAADTSKRPPIKGFAPIKRKP